MYEEIEASVSLKQRERGLSEAQFVLGVADSIALGARCLDDLAVARSDIAQEQLRGFAVPAPQTAGPSTGMKTFPDPSLDACRSLVLVDVQSWMAASRPHVRGPQKFYAPSLNLYVAFHDPPTGQRVAALRRVRAGRPARSHGMDRSPLVGRRPPGRVGWRPTPVPPGAARNHLTSPHNPCPVAVRYAHTASKGSPG
jgi:hypothetical protein